MLKIAVQLRKNAAADLRLAERLQNAVAAAVARKAA